MALKQKLQLKNNPIHIINQPPTVDLSELETIGEPTTPATLFFATKIADLQAHIPALLKDATPDTLFWLAFPKKSSKIETELSRDISWEIFETAGYRPIRIISLDDNWSALRFVPAPSEDPVTVQYAKKPDLKPIYDALLAYALTLGDDIAITKRKSYVALKRKNIFATLKPATKLRFELDLKLSEPAVSEKITEIPPGKGASGAMTHRIEIMAGGSVDDFIKRSLRLAYES